MQKKLSPDYSHNNQKGWSQLLCEEMADNFFCIYSNDPNPCNRPLQDLGPCRRNYQLFPHIMIERAGPNYYVRKRVIISPAFIVMGPSLVITTRPGPIAINAEAQLIIWPNLAQHDVALYRNQSDWVRWPKMTWLYIGANQIGPASRTNQIAPNPSTIRLC